MFLKKNHNFPLSMTPEMAIFAIQAKWVKNVFFFLMGNIECGFEQVNFLWKYKFMYIAGKKTSSHVYLYKVTLNIKLKIILEGHSGSFSYTVLEFFVLLLISWSKLLLKNVQHLLNSPYMYIHMHHKWLKMYL